MATGGASRLASELLLAIFRPIRRIALDPALAPSMMKSRGTGRALMFDLANFALWAKEIEAAEHGDLEPLIKALRSQYRRRCARRWRTFSVRSVKSSSDV
jgi:hypothetical protein